jgi:deoxycytidine triphosphate deaminase
MIAPWPTDIYETGFYVQMVMFDLSSAADNPYDGRYQNQFGLTPGKAEKV